jgi:hypothetical protein
MPTTKRIVNFRIDEVEWATYQMICAKEPISANAAISKYMKGVNDAAIENDKTKTLKRITWKAWKRMNPRQPNKGSKAIRGKKVS